uniref:DUF753 domain-containing protein n=1 Tax=Anopheles dirus TaxID=7168 RepID=A0A182NUD6_9DIPT
MHVCHVCDDCYAVDQAAGDKRECNLHETDRCYTGYAWSTKRTYRGCWREDLPSFDSFEECDGDGCNRRDFPTHLQCYQCVGCDRIPDEGVNYCRSVEATGCFMMITDDAEQGGGKTLVRGCNTDEAYDDCRVERNCVTCAEEQCNNSPRTARRLCDRCAGALECEGLVGPAASCLDTTFTNQCYLYSDGDGELTKGCLLDLDPASQVAEACYDPNDARCSICKEATCSRQHCVRCDTRIDGLACLLANKQAPLRYTLCAGACRVQIDADGNTVRGCATDFAEPCAVDSETCAETAAPGSNGGVYPLERRQCYQCEGELCLGEQQAANGQYCRLYGSNSDSCYIYNDGTVVVRGCTTDPEAKCTDNDAAYCTIQPDSLSNGAGQELAQAITCYQDCSPGGSEQIPSCPPITCPPAADRCYVSVSDSGVISRGCTSQDGGCPPLYRDCFTCKESNCNGVYAVCSKCDTTIDEDCSVAEEHGAICEQAIGCFHYQDENQAVYGCAEQAPAECATDAEHCRTCEGVFCNEKVLNSCFSCTDCPDVLNPIQRTKVCAADGDRCATGIVGKSVVRDCLLEMPDEYLPVQDCTEWSCNGLKITQCYQCTDCPETPDASDATPCINPSTDQCYTVLYNRQINRGCATTDEIAECDDGVNCAVCDDDKCNGLAIPTEFSCVRCQGASNCADYNVLSECIIGLPLLFEGCVTYTDGESVVKGCLSEVDLYISCAGGTNSEQCSVAMAPKGNARPVQCLECTAGIACVQGNPSELTVGTYEHGSCVALVNANGMVERGNALNYPAACQDPSASCHECFTDRCNEGLFPPGRLLCYQCDGAECAQLPLPAAYVPQPCLRHDPASAMCYTWYEGASDARRGCLLDDTAVCAAPGVSCQSCSESGCNDLGYDAFVVTEHCVQCSTNGACERNPAEEHCSGPGGCYTFTAGSFVIAKGCVSELQESMTWYNDCASGSSSDSCRHCFGDYCNRNRCFVCNSRLDGGASCVDPVVGLTDSVVCPDSDTCVAFLDGEGHTVRGCGDTYVEECAESGDTCQQCRGDHCNGRPLPGDRIKCYQCSGSADECLTPPKGSDSYCAIYREGEESCFTHFTDETTVERGCTLHREQPCARNCQTCDTTGCNDQPALVPNPLNCVQCSGDECTDSVNPTLCPEEILFGHPDHCYTYFHPDGTRDRGCFSGLAKSGSATADQCLDARDDLCKLCSPGGCNARSVQCFACDSNAHPGCAGVLSEAADDSLIKTCGTGQCVSLVEETTTRKGCSEDYEEQCAMPGAVCETFDGALSNGETYPAQRLQCVQCSGTGCDSSQLSATPSACQAYVLGDECYTYVADNGDTFRGCLSDPDANRCTEHSDHCVRCSSKSGCNTDPSESSNELICAKCTSTGCEQGERYERCTRDVLLGRTDSCYIYSFNGEVLARGCLSDAEESVRDACTSGSGSGSDCSVCQCDRCNGPPVRCVDCQGKTGCGEILGQAANLVQCRTSACVSFVKYATDEPSLIVKGCSELYEQETCVKKSDNPDYELCHSTQCNDVLFPERRLKCYQCVADACNDRSLEPTICEPYRAAGEMCYSFLDHQEKGCLGQLEDPEQCSRDEGPCRVCDGSDGCNVEPRALECTVCTSKTDSSCVDPTATSKDKKICSVGGCTTFIDRLSSFDSGCYTCYTSTPATPERLLFHRGCTGDERQTRCEPETVQVCLGAGCNNRNERLQICAKCDGECEDGRWFVEECRGTVEYERRGCYLIRDARKRILSRGCVADLNEDGWQRCSNVKDTSCITCLDNECNHAATGLLGRMSVICMLLVTFITLIL